MFWILKKDRRYDKIILLKRFGDSYRFIKKKYFGSATKSISSGKNTFKIPRHPNYINKYGKFVYFMDIDDGKSVDFSQLKSKNILTPTDLDIFLRRGLVANFVRAFGMSFKQDLMIILLAILAGVGIGFMIKTLIG